MKLSKLIKQLEKIKAEHGDVEVMVDVDEHLVQIEEAKFNKWKDSRGIIYLGLTEGIDY